ncbi:DUF4255 domain-containing protein [Sorangium sp. So ce726]|uniref:DUF4255 domain-containing protein n=1 Tax=Sorangium sp. So ce726 TaxID=3133319 RepID=UPI003F60D775
MCARSLGDLAEGVVLSLGGGAGLATHHAAAAIGETLAKLLEGAALQSSETFQRAPFTFVRDLRSPPAQGATVYLYRVSVSPSRHNFQARTNAQGQRFRAPLPIDFHYLVTAWGRDAREQSALLVWVMRQLEDLGPLRAAVLNHHYGTTAAPFHEDEEVQVTFEPLTLQDHVNVWEVAKASMQTSAAYVARAVPIDTTETESRHGPVQTREFVAGPQVSP